MREIRGVRRTATTLVAGAALAACALGAAACASGSTAAPTRAAPTATASASHGSPTAVVFPTAPASADQPVWDFVRRWQGADIAPILRPTYIPAGLASVTIGQPPNKRDAHILDVEYSGSGKQLTIMAGPLNPSSEGTPPTQVTVRGVAATLAPDEGGAGTIAVWWKEPGQTAGDLYEVFARGLSADEVLRVAKSLEPIGG